jgi:hypothetical protein
VVGVEQWAEIRRLHFVKGFSQREIHRRTGLHRDTLGNPVSIRASTAAERNRAANGDDRDPRARHADSVASVDRRHNQWPGTAS